ncbi:thioredoxin reductase [Dongia mobilis]|uniref:Thioredoxin reductase n=1 Tax=Dongia mobilis TaxID=578943 RepID=A0A4R6WIH0_9PROT|nr:FAD-dependent oxidoreductase [Dongia mobilis]TDQ78419.1 thioredoxin reductase [Dongia mobilis]
MISTSPDVLIVGAGAAGLAAAIALADAGVADIVVIDRDDAPGGLPRFCHHPGFGWEYAHYPRTGPGFARYMLNAADRPNIRILCKTTMISINAGPSVQIVGPETSYTELLPKAVILATGIRESNRGNLCVPGIRPERGIFTTGMLQQLVARRDGQLDQFRNLTVIGTEHVAFSALLTARHGGATVRHMIGCEHRIFSFPIMRLLAGVLAARIHLDTELLEIDGSSERVEALVVRQGGTTRRIACDGIVFSAGWTPETAAFVGSAVEVDPATGGIAIDQAMRSSLPGVFAAGNVLRPVESSGWAACEGRRAGQLAAKYLAGELSGVRGALHLRPGKGLKYVVPQYWDGPFVSPAGVEPLRPSARVAGDTKGALTLLSDSGREKLGKFQRLLQTRRINFSLAKQTLNSDAVIDVS